MAILHFDMDKEAYVDEEAVLRIETMERDMVPDDQVLHMGEHDEMEQNELLLLNIREYKPVCVNTHFAG